MFLFLGIGGMILVDMLGFSKERWDTEERVYVS